MTTRVAQAYDQWHSLHEGQDDGNAPWHQMLRAHLRILANARVLEIACGRGGLARWLSGLSPDCQPGAVIACDLSHLAVRTASLRDDSHSSSRLAFCVADLTNLPCKQASFDVAISCETIEHLPDPRAGLHELARVLRPGGSLYLTCPNYLNLMGLYRLYLPFTGRVFSEGGQPISRFLVAPRVRQWVKQAGFTIERVAASGHYVPFPRRSPIRLQWLDRWTFVSRYMGLHWLIVATKLG